MYVTYKPEDGNEPPRTWEFDPNDVRSSEQAIVEKQYGAPWPEFATKCLQGEAAARRVLLWHLIRRDGHVLSFRDTPDFRGRELLIERTATEAQRGYDEWVKAGGPADDPGGFLAAMFEREIEEARAKFGEPEGKAPSRNEPVPTSGP